MANSEVIIIIFPSRSVLTKALDHITGLEDFRIKRAAIIARVKDGETIVVGDDISADEGAIAGGTLGALMTALGLIQLGALTLPGIGIILTILVGVLLGGLIGGATGRFATNLLESGLKSAQIEAMAQQLEENHPALIIELNEDAENLPRLRHELRDYRAELVERLKDTKYGQSAKEQRKNND